MKIVTEGYISPVEILNLLGIQIPESGVFVGSFDRPLIEGALRLIGESISLQAIPDDKVQALQQSITAFVKTVDPTMGALAERAAATPENAAKMRSTIGAILCQSFNFRHPI